VVFVNRKEDTNTSLLASIEHCVPTELCTAINGNGFQVKTIEHVLSALAGLEVDNVYIDVTGNEIPVMDGSAAPFVRLIRSVGVISQGRRQPFLKITAPIEVSEGSKCVRIEPSATSRITYSIHYDHPLINTQTYVHECSANAFESQIAEARTFGFLHEVQALWARGLGKGGTLDNTVVLSKDGIVNQSGLRFLNEFVRHKVLDLIGDFSLLGTSFIGHIIAERSGHALHTRLVQRILEQPEKWVLLNADPLAEEQRPAMHMARLQPAIALQAS
jgi:UDP-3-O-[3-hydroxymyristoyl] N-acetylglucosamine deacetylase